MASRQDASIYHEVAGGADLLQWFGQVPTFHDAEILSLDLRRNSESKLRLHGWIVTGETDRNGLAILDRHAVVTFALESLMDLQLDGFSAQNVIAGLFLRRASNEPARRNFLALDPMPQDIEIELEPCYGLSGIIRARSVSITYCPGEPAS